MADRRVGRYTVHCSHESFLYFPTAHISKGQLIDYYQRIAPYMIPYVKNRLMTLQRFPKGIEGDGFYQKNTPDYFPAFIERKKVRKKSDGIVKYLMCNNAATLVYATNQGMITPHITLSKTDKLQYPDRIIFDLDPPSHFSFADLIDVAYMLKDIIEAHHLIPFVMTTGSRGLHVVIPIKREYTFKKVKKWAQLIAQDVVSAWPKKLTIEVSKAKRRNRIFVDYLRNSYGATAVAPYAVRALEYAPIAMPLGWQELANVSSSRHYTMKNVFKRLTRVEDPWKQYARSARSID